jgi:hypothetical protein
MHRTTPIQLAVLLTFGFMLTIGSTMIAALQLKPGLAYCKLRDLDWYRTASPRVQRETAHQALAFWFGDPHDAFAILERFGDRSSIPHLRAALAKQPSDQADVVTCTWIHGRHALERIQRSQLANSAQ